MAQNADVLASALQDLESDWTETFMKSVPLFNYMLGPVEGEGAKGKMQAMKLKGPYKEFGIVTNGPGTMINAPTGDEFLAGIRRNVAHRGDQYTARSVYYYNVDGWTLQEAGGEQDYLKIIDDYPKLAFMDAKSIVARQIARGASSAAVDPVANGAAGITTLNGLQTYNPLGTARQGVFQFVAPSSQTNTVFGQVLQAGTGGLTGWYHQHSHISSFAAEGMKKYRALVRLCNAQGSKLEGGGVDLVVSDPQTWNNMLEHHDNAVTMIDKTGYPLAKFLNRDGFKIGSVDWYADDDIDITDTTSFDGSAGGLNARQGVAYVLSTSWWEMVYQAQHPDMMGTGFFDMAHKIPLQDQVHWQFRILSNFNFFCRSLRNQGDLTGGAQE